MQPDTAAYLDSLTGHPEGDERAWRARYAPLIAWIKGPPPTDPPSRPRVTLVLVAWRAHEGFKEALDHIGAQRHIARQEMEVVLVDNCEAPRSLDALAPCLRAHVDVHIKMKGNVGASPARNAGAAHARAPILCFLDDDGLIDVDYITTGLDYFAQDDAIAAIRSRILARRHPYFTTLAGHYDRGTRPIEDGLITEGSMMIRRALYMEAGGFDDQLYGHEGIELTYQLKRLDRALKVLYVPDMIMRHDYIHTWQKFIEKTTRYAQLGAPKVTRDPDLQAFMDDFFARRFPRSPLPFDKLLARQLLRLCTTILELLVAQQATKKKKKERA